MGRQIFLVIAVAVFLQVRCQKLVAETAQELYYSTVVDKKLLDDVLPAPTDGSNKTQMRDILKDLVKLDKLNKTIHELVESTKISTQYRNHLNGFKVILIEVLDDACDWFKATFNQTCSFGSLRTKLELYEQLSKTEESLGKLVKPSCST